MKYKKINQAVLAAFMSGLAVTGAQAESKVSVSGLVEASVSKADSADAQFAVDTVELVVSAAVSENVSAEVVLLSEDIGTEDESESEFGIDTAVITLATQIGDVSAGKMIVPFTTGETNFITDSQTLEEPVGYGVALSGTVNQFGYTLYVADPDNDYTGAADQNAEAFGDVGGLSVTYEADDQFSLHGSVVSLNGNRSSSFAALVSVDALGVIAEATNIDGEDKMRLNTEVSYAFDFGTAFVAAQQAGDGDVYRMLGYMTEIYENTTFKLEYNLNATDDEASYAAQIGVEF